MITRPTNVFDPNFDAELKIFVAQGKAIADNAAAHENFLKLSSQWLDNYTALGKPTGPPPTPPLMTVVSDTGEVTHPPFPDLVTPTPPTFNAPSSGSIVSTSNIPMDRTDKMILMMGVLNSKLDALLAKG